MNSNTLIGLSSLVSALYLGNKTIGFLGASKQLTASHLPQEPLSTADQINAAAEAAGIAALGYGAATLGSLVLGVYFLHKR